MPLIPPQAAIFPAMKPSRAGQISLRAVGEALAMKLIGRAIAATPSSGPVFTMAHYAAPGDCESGEPAYRVLAALRDRWDASLSVSVVRTNCRDGVSAGGHGLMKEDRQLLLVKTDHGASRSVSAPGAIDFGWASFSAQWLSCRSLAYAGHLWPRLTPPTARRHFAVQSADDWMAFLVLRARELRHGGHLLVVQPCIGESQSSAFPGMMAAAQQVLEGLAQCGLLRPVESARMTVPYYERQVSEIRAPFQSGEFRDLEVVNDIVDDLPDQPWEDFLALGDARVLAEHYASCFADSFLPHLLAALDVGRDIAFRAAFAQRMLDGLRHIVLARPASWQAPLMVHALMLRKP